MAGPIEPLDNNSLPRFHDKQARREEAGGRLNIQQTRPQHPLLRAAVQGAGWSVGPHADNVDDRAGGALLGHQQKQGVRQGFEHQLAPRPGPKASGDRSNNGGEWLSASVKGRLLSSLGIGDHFSEPSHPGNRMQERKRARKTHRTRSPSP